MENVYELLNKSFNVNLKNNIIILNGNIYIQKFNNYLRFEMFDIIDITKNDYYEALEFVNEANQELKIAKLYVGNNVNLIAYIKINNDMLNMIRDLLIEVDVINNMI